MLARIVEAAGIPTIVVIMMPEIAERFRLPRVVGVEFPLVTPLECLTTARCSGQLRLPRYLYMSGLIFRLERMSP